MGNVVRETADTVYASFSRLGAGQREALVEKLLRDPRFREELLDIATIEQRRGEPGRSLRSYLAGRRPK